MRDSVLKVENVRVLRGGRLVKADLWVVNGKVVDPEARFWAASTEDAYGPQQVVDGKGGIVAPGFIDLQFNGGYGVDFSQTDVTVEQIREVAHKLLATGVTSFCPTVISSHPEKYRAVLATFKRAFEEQSERIKQQKMTTEPVKDEASKMLGLHLEGPFINKQRKGAHEEATLREPVEGLESVLECYGTLENVSIVTMAPELEGAMQAIRGLADSGVIVSAGHSSATIDIAVEAVKHGVTKLTHLFSAMAPFHHRDPGLIGLLGENTYRPFYGMILDGIHCHPTSVRIMERCHPAGLVLVTDAMAGMGLPPAQYELAGQHVDVQEHAAYLVGTTTLAGSIVSMDTCIRKLVEFTDCSIELALEAATSHPAQVLGGEVLEHKGSLAFGADADFVLLDNDLRVVQTYIAGNLVYDSQSTN